MKKKIVITIGVSVLLTSLVFIWLQRPSLKIIKSWKQPESINYNSFDPYFVNIVKDNIDLGHLPFTIPQNYFIYVGKESTEVTYGHIKNYSFEYNQNIIEYLDLCTVQWSPEGVSFKEPSGHTLFIPKKSFIGGR
ncbi:MAG: hypothetical protein ACQESH_08170 [Campylobacterota bacterium]